VRLAAAFTSQTYTRMTGAQHAPDGSWYVLEQPGRVLVVRDGQSRLFLDVTGRVNADGNEEGLLGLAFSPQFAQNGVYFLSYTASNPRRSVVSSFTVTGGPSSEAVILQVDQPFSNHNGGQIAFGPDGLLYVALGDGGSGGDPLGHGQNRATLLGDLLRIDVSDRTRYTVPPSNPFVGQAGVRPEIWAYGLRNPWRFSFDMASGDLWLGDVGQSGWEEINLIQRGGNYGWNRMEGNHCFSPQTGCSTSGLVGPVLEYPTRPPECSVTGGFVYRGSTIPALRGSYVYGDYCSGKIWALRVVNGRVESAQIASAGFNISSFAQDRDGEIYVLQHAGAGVIRRLAP